MINKVIKDHKVKSDQLRLLKRKLKNSISKNKLREMLNTEESRKVNYNDYLGYYGFDDEGYGKKCNEIESRIKLLKELLGE